MHRNVLSGVYLPNTMAIEDDDDHDHVRGVDSKLWVNEVRPTKMDPRARWLMNRLYEIVEVKIRALCLQLFFQLVHLECRNSFICFERNNTNFNLFIFAHTRDSGIMKKLNKFSYPRWIYKIRKAILSLCQFTCISNYCCASWFSFPMATSHFSRPISVLSLSINK